MNFNSRRKHVARFLSLLSVAGTAFGTSIQRPMFAYNKDLHFGNGKSGGEHASELEIETLINSDNELNKCKVIKSKADLAKWQININVGKFSTGGNPEPAPGGLKLGELATIETGGDGDDRSAENLKNQLDVLTQLIDNTKLQSVYDSQISVAALRCANSLSYRLGGTNQAEANLNVNIGLNETSPKPESDIVYFHVGEAVYATTAEILMKAQTLTGETGNNTADNATFLAQESPLAANLLLTIYKKIEANKRQGVVEVKWLKYKHQRDKLQPASGKNGGYYPDNMTKIGSRDLADKAQGEELTFKNTSGQTYIIGQNGSMQRASASNLSNAYKTSLTLTRTITGEASYRERAGYLYNEYKTPVTAAIIAYLSGIGSDELASMFAGRWSFAGESQGEEDEERDREKGENEEYTWEE